MTDDKKLVWVDVETTGLDLDRDVILEIALVITDGDLNEIASAAYPIQQSDAVLQGMDPWCVKTHGASGLTEACQASPFIMRAAEERLLYLVRQHVPLRTAALAGSSVWTDRIYLRRLMPELEACLHYRCVDVSAFKEMLARWKPQLMTFQKRMAHRAMEDIRESIAELAYYRHALGCD